MDKKWLMKKAAQSIIDADEAKALEIVHEAEKNGMDLMELLSDGFSEGMTTLGKSFSKGEVFLPELIYVSEILKAVSGVIESKVISEITTNKCKMILGTVAGDVHDIGKGIVAALAKNNGVEVFDLGREVPAEKFLDKAIEVDADIIGSSALLTSTMEEQKKIEGMLNETDKKEKIKTIVGGAPVTKRWADKIGADCYCEDAAAMVNYINDYFNE